MAIVPVSKRIHGPLGRLQDEMEDLMSGFFGNWPGTFFERGTWPALDVSESENEITVKAEVPGCKADDIDISVHGNTLIISGEKKQEEEKKEKGYYRMERSYGSFRRDVTLPSDVDPAKVSAACKDGILTINLPKTERAKAIKVKVKEA